MQKLPLIVGIPLVFAAGILAYETGELVWLGLTLPLFVLRRFMRDELSAKDPFAKPDLMRAEQTDRAYTTEHKG